MRRILFSIILLLSVSVLYGLDIDCIPRSFSANPLVAEKICDKYIGDNCVCRVEDGNMLCNFDLKEDVDITCKGSECTIEMLGEKNSISNVPPNLNNNAVEFICESTTGARCECTETGSGTTACKIIKVSSESVCDDTGCTIYIGEWAKRLDYCRLNESRVLIERSSDGLSARVEGYVQNTEDGRQVLRDGMISVSGELGRGIRVDIIADLDSIEENPDTNAIRTEIKEEIKENFRKAIRMRYNTENFETLDAIEITHRGLRNGEHIRSATIRFRVPKELIKPGKSVVILRYGDDGTVSVLDPVVSEEDGYYIYSVNPNGLSLYAVATVNQISGGIGEEGLSSTGNAQEKVCGAFGIILLLLSALYTVSKSM